MSKDWTGNSNSIYRMLGASNHTEEERQTDDYYATEPIAIDKLLTVETPNEKVWECACGAGHLSERLKQYGYSVYSTDIKNRGYDIDELQDFLTATKLPIENCDIITNPPYKYALEFVLKSLELLENGRKCYMLLRLQFLEGQARYNKIFKDTPPKKVYAFSKRVTCAKNANFEKQGNGAVAYAWFVWQKGYKGKTTIEWI